MLRNCYRPSFLSLSFLLFSLPLVVLLLFLFRPLPRSARQIDFRAEPTSAPSHHITSHHGRTGRRLRDVTRARLTHTLRAKAKVELGCAWLGFLAGCCQESKNSQLSPPSLHGGQGRKEKEREEKLSKEVNWPWCSCPSVSCSM